MVWRADCDDCADWFDLPPVGMNLFVLNSLLPNVGLGAIFRGCWPFVVVMIGVLGLLITFPGLSLWLPSLMK